MMHIILATFQILNLNIEIRNKIQIANVQNVTSHI